MLFFKKKEKKVEEPIVSAPKTPEQILDDAGVDMKVGLELLCNSTEIFDITVQTFLEDTDEKRTLMQECINNGDMKNFAIYVHGVKSNAKNFGAGKLAEIAYEFELKAKADDAAFVSANYDKLICEWDKVLGGITRYLETVN